jgi:hypothetical protein
MPAHTPATIVFFINIAWMMVHELDAIDRHEWRIFQTFVPLYDRLDDVNAYRFFAVLHVPLLAWILWAAQFRGVQVGFDLFLLIHIGLHRLFRHHPQNALNNWFSQFLIIGVAPFALLHLGLIVRG